MKISKTSWIILILGILVVAFGTLGVARTQQVQEQKQLEEELAIAELRLSKIQFGDLRSQQDELEIQLEQATSKVVAVKDDFRQPVESIPVVDALFEIAEASGVEIRDVSSTGLGSEELDGINCSVIRLAIRVEGEVPNLIAYVTKLNNDFITGLVGSVQVNTAEEYEETGGEGEEVGEPTEGDGNPSVNIQMTVYSYQGD